MIQFILNNREIKTALSPGLTLLDFIRYEQQLTGTKIGCREGDCGACTILTGEIKNDKLVYSSATSCLMPLGNATGKHIVTIEGLNLEDLNAMQHAFAEQGATQCGFCTPGFIVSLAGFCISENEPTYSNAIDAVNGNICRCTGYKSIERAAATISKKMEQRNGSDVLEFAIEHEMVPSYFSGIKERLQKISFLAGEKISSGTQPKYVAGGTDLYVQQHETIVHEKIDFLFDKQNLKGITKNGNTCEMGAAVTVSDIAYSSIFKQYFPKLDEYIKLVSSTQIRNMATIAGNFTNASPIGDLTMFFLALNARLKLTNEQSSREIDLKHLYKTYKFLNKTPDEIVEKIYFELPGDNDHFNFEKVCKRTNLDIASVNTAIYLRIEDNVITTAGLSAGGVGPIPTYLSKCSEFLIGKKVSATLISQLITIAQTEVSPISDARGTETYKRLLLSQLIKAHFIKLFPGLPVEQFMYS